MTSFEILAVTLGQARAFRDGEASAIAKQPAQGLVAIGREGLAGDQQADRVHHGGPDMAIHYYPREHYGYWRDYLGGHALFDGHGALGENVASLGLVETEACIGDRYRLGTALVEISQGRKPCWKIDHRFGHKGMSAEVVRTGRAGWYFRVIEEGAVQAGDALQLLDRPHPGWSVARVFTLIVAGGHKDDPGTLGDLAGLAPLSQEWRRRAALLAA